MIALKIQFDWTVTAIASLGIFIGGTVWSWLYLRYRSEVYRDPEGNELVEKSERVSNAFRLEEDRSR